TIVDRGVDPFRRCGVVAPEQCAGHGLDRSRAVGGALLDLRDPDVRYGADAGDPDVDQLHRLVVESLGVGSPVRLVEGLGDGLDPDVVDVAVRCRDAKFVALPDVTAVHTSFEGDVLGGNTVGLELSGGLACEPVHLRLQQVQIGIRGGGPHGGGDLVPDVGGQQADGGGDARVSGHDDTW